MLTKINGYETALVDVGEGPRVLVTQGGWIGNWELWKLQAESLSDRGWRVIAFDHRGSGASRAPIDEIGIEAMVDDLFAVMDHCRVDKVVIAGESMGSLVVERAAERAPERFSHLIIVAGAARFPRTPTMRAFAMGLKYQYSTTLKLFVRLATPERSAGKRIRAWGMSFLRLAQPDAARRLFSVLAGADQRDIVRRITTPTLVVHGVADLIVPYPLGKELAKLIPNAQLVSMPWVGHVPTMTRPDEICRAIEDFTSRN